MEERSKLIKLTEEGELEVVGPKDDQSGMEEGYEQKKTSPQNLDGREFEEVRPFRRRRSLGGSWVERHQGVASRLG